MSPRGTPPDGPTGRARPGSPGSGPAPLQLGEPGLLRLPGRVQRERQREDAGRSERRRASGHADRAPARRPPTTSGLRARRLSARQRSARRASAGGGRTFRPATRQGCSRRSPRCPAGQRARRARARSGASIPPPAPWLRSSVATGGGPGDVTSRASPCGVGIVRTSLMSAIVTDDRPHGVSASGQRLDQLGSVVADVGDHRGHRVGLEPSRRGRLQQRQQVLAVAPGARVEPGRPALRRSTISGIRSWMWPSAVLGLGGQHRAGPAEPVRVVLVARRDRARSRRARPSPARRRPWAG